ncbi:MAG: ABC transporter permease, partial [Candidatus Limnocylindrales bacterium]
GFAFAAVGMAATTWVRRWTDFDWIFVVTLPLFLFSATFYPIEVYPEPLRTLISLTPLSQGVEMLRSFALGHVGSGLLGNVAYLVVMGLIGLVVVDRRLARLLLK